MNFYLSLEVHIAGSFFCKECTSRYTMAHCPRITGCLQWWLRRTFSRRWHFIVSWAAFLLICSSNHCCSHISLHSPTPRYWSQQTPHSRIISLSPGFFRGLQLACNGRFAGIRRSGKLHLFGSQPPTHCRSIEGYMLLHQAKTHRNVFWVCCRLSLEAISCGIVNFQRWAICCDPGTGWICCKSHPHYLSWCLECSNNLALGPPFNYESILRETLILIKTDDFWWIRVAGRNCPKKYQKE